MHCAFAGCDHWKLPIFHDEGGIRNDPVEWQRDNRINDGISVIRRPTILSNNGPPLLRACTYSMRFRGKCERHVNRAEFFLQFQIFHPFLFEFFINILLLCKKEIIRYIFIYWEVKFLRYVYIRTYIRIYIYI